MKLLRLCYLLVFVSFILQACAKPNYQDKTTSIAGTSDNKPNPSPSNEKPQEQTCDLYLSKSEICLHVQWLQQPNSQSNAAFLLSFTQGKTANPLTPEAFENITASLKIILWMPSMGHGSVPVLIKKNTDTQSLNVERVYFIMPGDWEIRFQLKENESIIDETRISLSI